MAHKSTEHPAPGSTSLLRLAALACVLAAGLPATALGEEYNSEGWTILRPAEDTRFVFVSSSEGNDLNSGRSPAEAVRSITRAKDLMRDNSPDWMLLRRGDTWNESFGSWSLSGRSEDERVVIASYGDGDTRPKLVCSAGNTGIAGTYGQDVSHVAIVGLHFQADRPDDGSSTRGIKWQSTGEDLLIEDCYVGGFFSNITVEGLSEGFENVAIRRCVVVDAWSLSGHSQGVFINDVTGVLMEENFIDRNGWDPDIDGADADTFRQNVYIQAGVTDVVFRGNISSRAAAAGVQVRSGAIAENNLLYANTLAMRFGYRTLDWPQQFATGVIRGNVVLGGPLSHEVNEVFGIWTERVKNVVVEDNVVANAGEGQLPIAYTMGAYADNVTFRNNVAFDWMQGDEGQAFKSGAQAQGPVLFENNHWVMPGSTKVLVVQRTENFTFSDNAIEGVNPNAEAFVVDSAGLEFSEWMARPNVQGNTISDIRFEDEGRDLKTYARSLGLVDEQGFIAAARQMSRRNWNPALTGTAATAWIRAGFEVVPN